MQLKDALPIGTILDSGIRKYTIKSVLGQGGFGITYLATAQVLVENIPFEVSFAIKEHYISSLNERQGTSVSISNINNTEEIRESIDGFLVEAQRLNKLSLNHPGIVRVNENFRANGTAYYVMEYIKGQSLREFVKQSQQGRLPEVEALKLFRPVAETIGYLHDNRVTHLDIKPDNILIRENGHPVVIDFGLSKHYNNKGTPTSTIKAAGCSAGYSPMEQYVGITSFTPEADIYALGGTLLYMLTGKDPKVSTEINSDIIRRSLPGDVSEQTADAIVKAMEILKENRPKSVAHFLNAMEGSANGTLEPRRSLQKDSVTKVIRQKGSISDRYTLPKGFVLRSPNARYLITDILEESDCYIRYGATLFSGSQTDETGNATTKRKYTVMELFNKKAYKREQDESVSLTNPSAASMTHIRKEFLSACKKHIGLTENESADFDHNIVVREIFNSNGTTYAAIKHKWKPVPPLVLLWEKVVGILRHKLKQIVVSALGFILVAMAANYFVNQCNQPRGKDEKPQEKPHEEMVRRVENFDYNVPNIGKGRYTGQLDAESLPDDPKGKIVFGENKEYNGPFVHGKLEGEGASYTFNGQSFEGSFKDNQYESGTLTFLQDGTFYRGDFKNGMPYNGTWFTKDNVRIYDVKEGKEII